MSSPAWPRHFTLIALGLTEALLMVILGWLPAAHAFPWPGLLVFAAAFATYALAASQLIRAGGPDRAAVPGPNGEDGTERGNQDGVASLRTIWLIAVVMRVALLPLAPELTDDFYRYLWDGHVQLAGTNPYLYAPGAPEVEGLRTAWHHLINNPTVPTIYPPLAQLVFLMIALGGSSITLMKLIWIACDLERSGSVVLPLRVTLPIFPQALHDELELTAAVLLADQLLGNWLLVLAGGSAAVDHATFVEDGFWRDHLGHGSVPRSVPGRVLAGMAGPAGARRDVAVVRDCDGPIVHSLARSRIR